MPFEESAGEQWLLIHKRDDASVDGWDAEDHPESVKTGRTNDEVKASRDAIWISQAPAARRGDRPVGGEGGEAAGVHPADGRDAHRQGLPRRRTGCSRSSGTAIGSRPSSGTATARICTRNGNDGETYFPKLLTNATWIEAKEAIVDGEVVAIGEDGLPDFSLLQEAHRRRSSTRLVYQAFDLLYLDGRSLLNVPLESRKQLLRSVLRPGDRRVRFADHIVTEGMAFLEAAAPQQLEGIIAKHRRSIYEPGKRSRTWLKVKVRPEQELVVGGWTPGEGAREGPRRARGRLLRGRRQGEEAPLRRQGRLGLQHADAQDAA